MSDNAAIVLLTALLVGAALAVVFRMASCEEHRHEQNAKARMQSTGRPFDAGVPVEPEPERKP